MKNLLKLLTLRYHIFSIALFCFISSSAQPSSDWMATMLGTDKREVELMAKAEWGFWIPEHIQEKVDAFKFNGQGLNPFDPDQADLSAEFTSPSGKIRKAVGFYMIDCRVKGNTWTHVSTKYYWRVRFAPDETGKWTAKFRFKYGKNELDVMDTDFTCLPSKHPGRIVAEPGKQFLKYSISGKPFFTIGHNIAHAAQLGFSPERNTIHKHWLKELADAGGNFFRLEMGAQNFLPDWVDHKNYLPRMGAMSSLDELVELCEERGLYFIMFRHHVELMNGAEWMEQRWGNNAYYRNFNKPNKKEYFTNEEMIKHQKNCLRYIMARWGYSAAMAFYGYSEVDNWIKDMAAEENSTIEKQIPTFVEFAKKMKACLHDELGYNHINYLCTYANTRDYEFKNPTKGVIALSAVAGFHKYQGEYKDMLPVFCFNRIQKMIKTFNKPVILEETGYDLPHLYCCTGVDFERSIWSTSFMGSAGSGMNWWWESLHTYDYQNMYKPLAEFFKDEDLTRWIYVPQRFVDGNITKAKTEMYALVDKNGERAIGYIHRADVHWRNLVTGNDCVKQLVEKNTLAQPCVLDDGGKIGVLNADENIRYNNQKFTDVHTATAEKGTDVRNSTETIEVELKGLKKRGLFKNKKFGYTYNVEIYKIANNQLVKIKDENVSLTSRKGRLKISVRAENGVYSYAFKVHWKIPKVDL